MQYWRWWAEYRRTVVTAVHDFAGHSDRGCDRNIDSEIDMDAVDDDDNEVMC